jgi:hypothetical protein
MSNKIELGDMVQDLVTGFKGVAVVREIHLFKCDRITVQPVVEKGNKMSEHFYTFDAQSLKVIKKGFVKKESTTEPQKDAGNAMSVSRRK